MSEARNLRAIGGVLVLVGVVVLLAGLAMSATSTQTGQTCVDDPSGFGQECVRGSVTTPNPLRGPTIGAGLLAVFGGVAVVLLGRGDDDPNGETATTGETGDGSFADKLRERQTGADDARPSPSGDGADAESGDSHSTTPMGERDSARSTSVLPENQVLGYGLSVLGGGVAGYVVLFSLASAFNFVFSFWLGTLAGAFVADAAYRDRFTLSQGIEVALAFAGAWYGTGVLYRAAGPLPRGVLGYLVLGVGVYAGAGVGVAVWRLVGERFLSLLRAD